MTATEAPPPQRRCMGELLAQLAGLTRELVEMARSRDRAGDDSGSVAFYSAAERLVEVVRAEDPLPVPPTGALPKLAADAFRTVLAGADSKIAAEVSTGRVDGRTAIRVFHSIRDQIAETDPVLAAGISPRITAMVTPGGALL